MTSQFDDLLTLACFWSEGWIPEHLRGEVRDIVNRAVEQASGHEAEWSFEAYLKKMEGTEKEIDQFLGYELAAKFRFLDETHTILDHQDKYHCRVFSGALGYQMRKLYRTLEDGGLKF